MTTLADRLEAQPVEVEQEVTPLELFFDLVFVFAITQVTGFVSGDPTWTRLVEGMAILTRRAPDRASPRSARGPCASCCCRRWARGEAAVAAVRAWAVVLRPG